MNFIILFAPQPSPELTHNPGRFFLPVALANRLIDFSDDSKPLESEKFLSLEVELNCGSQQHMTYGSASWLLERSRCSQVINAAFNPRQAGGALACPSACEPIKEHSSWFGVYCRRVAAMRRYEFSGGKNPFYLKLLFLCSLTLFRSLNSFNDTLVLAWSNKAHDSAASELSLR